MSSALCPLSPTRPPKRPRWVWLTAITDTAPYSCCLGSFTRPQNACLRFLTAGPGCHFQCGTNLGFSITNKDRPAIGNRNLAFFVPAPSLRAYLKNPTEIRSLRFGVPPLGGSGAVPPKGGAPNAVFRHALRGLWFWNFPAARKLEFGVFLTPALPHSLLLLLQFGLQRFAVADQLLLQLLHRLELPAI